MKRIILFMMVCSLMAVLFACSKEDEDTLVIGFFPANESDKIVDTVEPLAERLAEEIDMDVKSTVMTNYNALVDAMGANEVQIGFIPAFGYVLASEEYDVEVMLKSKRRGKGYYESIYVVRKDDNIKEISHLSEKTWAYPDKVSTSGYLFPASQLIDELNLASAVQLEEAFFAQTIETGTHEAAALSVLEGDADVATTHDNVLNNLSDDYPNIKEELTIMKKTEKVPNDTISVVKDLDADLVEKIKATFLKFNEDEEMVQIMNDVYRWDGIMEATDEEYDFVRQTYHEFKDIINN